MFTRPAKTVRPPLAVPPRPGPAPRCSSHLPGLWVTRHQQGFTHVRPSGLPLACAPGWSGNASASSLSFAPRSYPRRTSGRGLALNTGQELRHRHHRRPSNPRTHSPHATSCRTSSAQSSPTNKPHQILPSEMPDPVSSLRENNQRPNETVLTPPGAARHPSSDQLSRSPAGARSFHRAPGPADNSAHLPAATRYRVCRTANPLTLISGWSLSYGDTRRAIHA